MCPRMPAGVQNLPVCAAGGAVDHGAVPPQALARIQNLPVRAKEEIVNHALPTKDLNVSSELPGLCSNAVSEAVMGHDADLQHATTLQQLQQVPNPNGTQEVQAIPSQDNRVIVHVEYIGRKLGVRAHMLDEMKPVKAVSIPPRIMNSITLRSNAQYHDSHGRGGRDDSEALTAPTPSKTTTLPRHNVWRQDVQGTQKCLHHPEHMGESNEGDSAKQLWANWHTMSCGMQMARGKRHKR
jgi:hypothetical protein